MFALFILIPKTNHVCITALQLLVHPRLAPRHSVTRRARPHSANSSLRNSLQIRFILKFASCVGQLILRSTATPFRS